MKDFLSALSLVLTCILVLLGIIILIMWGSGKIAPPCDGGDTGVQTYRGDTIECYHGDVVRVIRR